MRRLLVGIAVLTVATLLAGARFYVSEHRLAQENAEHDLVAIAQLTQSSVEAWYREVQDDAQMLADLPLLRGSLSSPTAGLDPRRDAVIRSTLAGLIRHHDYDDVRLVGLDGRLLIGTTPLDPPEQAALRRAVETDAPAVSDLYTRATPRLSVVAPVHGMLAGSADIAGAVVLGIDPRRFLYPLIKSWPLPSRSAETVIVQRQGDRILFLHDVRFRPGAALKLTLPMTQTDVSYVQAASGTEGVVSAVDYRGVPVLAVLSRVAGTPWFMSTEIDMSEAYEEWHVLSALIILLLLLVPAGALAIGVLAWRASQKVGFEKLYYAEAELRASESRFKVVLESLGDAVVATDASGRVVLANAAAEAMTGWTADEARGRPLTEVVRILSPSGTPDPLAPILRGDSPARQAAGTLLSRGGTSCPVSYTTSPIRQCDECGVVMVLRDQSAEVEAQRALRESEQRYRLLADHVSDVIWVYDLGRERFTWCSPSVLAQRGFSAEEVLQQGLADALTPSSLLLAREVLETVLPRAAGGDEAARRVTVELEQTHKDGGAVSVEVVCTVRLDESGRPLELIGVTRDIRERRRAQAALEQEQRRLVETSQALEQANARLEERVRERTQQLAESEEQLRVAAHNADIGTFRFDFATSTVTCSTDYKWLYGVGPDDDMTLDADLLPPHVLAEDRPALLTALRAALDPTRDGRFYAEHRVLLENGGIRWIRIAGRTTFDAQHQPLRALGAALDITAMKEAEEALGEAQRQLATILDSMGDAFFSLDAAWRFTQVNKQAEAFLDHARADLLGRVIWDVLPVIGGSPFEASMQATMLEGRPTRLEAPSVVRPGRQVEVRLYPGPHGLSIFVTDITDRMVAEQQVRQLNETLEQRVRVRTSDLVASMRAQEMLSTCTAEVIRATSESDLLQRICDITNEMGGYALTWVGVAEHDDDRSVRPLAMAGVAQDYARATRVTWADSERGQGPTGRAVRTGQLCLCQDLLHDPEFGPWREAAARAGLAASIALPLTVDGQVVGALTCYASRANAFTPDEVRLLSEMVSNVAYGIQTLRTRAVRAQAEAELQRHREHLEDLVEQRSTALRTSEAKMRSLFAAMTDVIVVLDRDGIFVEIAPSNPPSAYRAPDTLLGKPLHALFEQADAESYLAQVRKTLDTSQPQHLDYTLVREGHRYYFSAALVPLARDRVLVVARDISERHEAEAALQASEVRYRSVFNGSGDAIFVRPLVDEPRPFVDLNEAACAILGYSREELLRMTPADLDVGPVDAILANLNRRLLQGERVLFETVVVARDGRKVPVEMSSQAFMLGGEAFGLEVLRDISERKRVEAEVLRLSQVVEQSPHPVVMTDLAADIIYVNPAFERITGYTAAQVQGKNPRLLQSGVHTREFYAEMWGTLTAGQVWRGEICNRRRGGELFWESAAIAPVRNAQGHVEFYIAISEDITRAKQIEADLREAKAAAESANRAKSTFLASMSHEIRTPLNAILGYTQLLRRDTSLPEAVRDKLQIINRSGDHLLELINDVLEMAKIEAGRVHIEPTSFELPALLRDMVDMFALRAEAKGLALRLVLEEGLPRFVVADAVRLRQIVVNLCGNALKFTLEGHIEVRAGSHVDDEGQIVLQLEVEDTGIGISASDCARLFQQFEQSRSGRRFETGTGLGLAISRQYARLMGGDITVRSVEGRGTTFIVTVPVGRGAIGAAAEGRNARRVVSLADGQAPVRVLVVDDNEANRMWLTSLLEEMRFEVRQVDGGEAAVRVAAEFVPDLILMDLVMPGIDGLEATRRIKATADGQRIAIFALTASAFDVDREETRAAGMLDVLGKPFEINELFDKIERHLGVRFRYDEDEAVPLGPRFDAVRVRALPPALVARLRSAVADGDQERITQDLAEVSDHDAEVGRYLGELAAQYEYDRLTEMLSWEAAG